MILLKSNFRFSKILSPGEPLQSRWSPTAPKDFGDTLWYSLETLCPSLLLFLTTDKSVWITTYTCHSYDHPPLILLLQDTPKFSLLFREYFVPTALQFFATWIPLRINPRTCRVSAHPQLFMCFTKVFKIIFDLPKILWSLWLLKFLLACIMVNPISLVVLMTFLVIIILSLLTQYVCEYTQSSLILIN